MNEQHPNSRPLSGLTIGISISESEDLSVFGFVPSDVNLVTVELCRRLIALGSGVNLGHQWRPGGVMDAVSQFARTYQEDLTEPIIHSFLAWPDRAGLSEDDRRQLSRVVQVHEGEELRPESGAENRAAALTAMRSRVASVSSASISLCGKLGALGPLPHEDWVPGLVEEAALMLDPSRPRPVYLSRMMGGAASFLIDVLEDGQPRSNLRPLPSSRLAGYLNPIAEFGVNRLADVCHLTGKQLEELFEAQNLDTIVRLTALGLHGGS